MRLLLRWIRTHRLEFALLVLLVLVGASLRLYQVGSTMHFGNDEGNTATAVRLIATGAAYPLLGPAAPNNWEGFHLGPFFYYYLAPFNWLSHGSPGSGAMATALLTSASVFLVYWIGRRMFGSVAGLASGSLFAVSFFMVYYGRWVWHPNIVPFFALLMFWSLYEFAQVQRQPNREVYLYLLAVSVGIIVQLHGTALIVVPAILAAYFSIFRPAVRWWKYLLAAGIVLLLNAPTILYDLTHQLANARGFYHILTQSDGGATLGLVDRARQSFGLLRDFWFESLLHSRAATVFYTLFAASLALFGVKLVTMVRDRRSIAAPVVVGLWLCLPAAMFIFYKQAIPPHYFSVLYPLPFLMLGWVVQYWWSVRWLRLPLAIAVVALVGWQLTFSVTLIRDVQLQGSRATSYPVTLAEMQEVVDYIVRDSGGTFSFQSLPTGSYDSSYRYLFERTGYVPALSDSPRYVAVITARQPQPPEAAPPLAVQAIGHLTVYTYAQ